MKTVHEVCESTGVTRKRLFYYDRIGLLKPSRRDGPQKSKLYSEKAVEQLKQILVYQDAGLRLAEIREIMTADHDRRREILEDVLARLHAEHARKEEEIRAAESLLRAYAGKE